jgi:hypothetical protein
MDEIRCGKEKIKELDEKARREEKAAISAQERMV